MRESPSSRVPILVSPAPQASQGVKLPYPILRSAMLVVDQKDIADAQHEVQRLLGRCILRLQQCEQLLKSMLAFQKLSGTTETLPKSLDNRKAEIGGKTMGMLVGHLTTECVLKEGSEFPDVPSRVHHDSSFVGLSIGLNISAESHAALQTDLHKLVHLRNTLAHHFIEQYDIRTVDGCLKAQDALSHSYTEIDRQLQQLRTLGATMAQGARVFAEWVQSPQSYDALVDGIASDGQIHWPSAGIVDALRLAFRQEAIDGWVNLNVAAHWMSEHHPKQTPQRYGCVRWRHVIHESRQFELRNFKHNGQQGAWFRARFDLAG